jgi:serine/threonine-protein kinase
MPDPITRLNAALDGRYRIDRELGEGGMATVYLADDLKHERKVALKVLKPELAAVVGAERFLAEIKTTANLQHPHILPLYDSGEADEFLYYVMPYVDGETVRERLDRDRQLPVKEAVAVAEAVASALDYAHRSNVIHRDIKPANILVHDGNPVVADFGIALAVSAAGGGRMTETGLSLGTPHYMSPEQAAADRELSARSDVYSLACVTPRIRAPRHSPCFCGFSPKNRGRLPRRGSPCPLT